MRSRNLALGLGSNLNHPLQNLRQALAEIKNIKFLKVLNVASIYESEALLPEVADESWNKNYLNSVVLCEVSSEIKHEDILEAIKNVEIKMGRHNLGKWAPRLIDIDILYLSDVSYKTDKLSIPHLHLFARPFALLPLIEVWPELKKDIEFNLQCPSWTKGFILNKPFNTVKSTKYFWPQMVGVLNITTDSFSDGGRYLNAELLHQQLSKLVLAGASIIDIGAESTRPMAHPIDVSLELKNLNWALNEIKTVEKKLNIKLSLDCRRAEVISEIVNKYNIQYLNDVGGFNNIEMKNILKESGLEAFVMHSLSIPPNNNLVINSILNPCEELTRWWVEKNNELELFGIKPEKLIFDPGLGFGKMPHQNLYVLNNLNEFFNIKRPIMVGHSRKSYQKLFSDRQASDRDLETVLTTVQMNLAYTQYLRVHDVELQSIALKFKGLHV